MGNSRPQEQERRQDESICILIRSNNYKEDTYFQNIYEEQK